MGANLPEFISVSSEWWWTKDPDGIAAGDPPLTGTCITLDESSSLVLSQPQPQPHRPELELGLSELSSNADADDESDKSSIKSSIVSSAIVSSNGNGGR